MSIAGTTPTTTALSLCSQSNSISNSNPIFGFFKVKTNHHSHPCFPKPRQPLPATCSLPDVTTSSPTTTVEVDSSFAVKRKSIEVLPQLRGTCIFLVGMNNTIKTSVGKLLAETLRYYYFDSDSLVEEAAGGKSAVESLKVSNEQSLRESETEVLKQLSSMGRLVVCAGDGAVQSSTNLALLRHGISIWIDVPLRIVAGETESVSKEEVLSELSSLFEEIKEGYATADATISLPKVASQLGYDEISEVTTEDMTLEVLKVIEQLTRVKKMMEEAASPF